MKSLNIFPDIYTYNLLIKASAKSKNIDKAEEYFAIAK